MNRFDELLEQLGQQLNVPLETDRHSACKIFINREIHVQMEYDEDRERIVFGSFVAEISPGKFRENVLKEGLKSNYPFATHGVLAYSERNNSLAYFEYIYTFNMNGEKLASALGQFADIAKQWKQAIQAGFFSPPPVPK